MMHIRPTFATCLLGFVCGLGWGAENSNPAVSHHAQDLVVLSGDRLVAFQTNRFPEASYTVLYFGAGWCSDCRRFSPALVSAYDGQKAGAKRFEVLLFPMDNSEADLVKFMRIEHMRWPAIAFDKLGKADDLKKYYSGHGIPFLSVFDAKGNLVLQSKSDQDALEILTRLQDLLNKK